MTAPAKPVIGVSSYRQIAEWRSWKREADLLNTEYADAVCRAGGVPVLIPFTDADGARAVVARLDALVISGGEDVDPGRYGETVGPHTDPPHPARDDSEFALLDAADARGLPTLGICRGMQVMAVHGGGSLIQHLPDKVGHDRHALGENRFGPMEIRTVADTHLRDVLGEDAEARCHHHQAVGEVPPRFTVSAYADDGTIEAMQRDDDRFFAVQWHPEMKPDDDRIFADLVARAAAFSRALAGAPTRAT